MKKATLLALALVPGAAAAQAPPPAGQQIAAAVSVLSGDQRAGATVWGYGADGKLTVLRRGTGYMTCLGNDPRGDAFHVACYHNSMEPFMARGRALRASGITGAEVDSVRFREVREGKLAMPQHPSAMYQFFGGTFDPAKGEVSGANVLYVVYIPFATAQSTGLLARPTPTAPQTPWIMFPGTPKAHIMFSPKM